MPHTLRPADDRGRRDATGIGPDRLTERREPPSAAEGLAYLDVAGVHKRFRETIVLVGLDLQVRAGEFVSLLGPSGCGKTTLLRVIAGLLPAERGLIRLDGVDLTRLPAHRRNIGVVFQNYALFPHLTVAENVAFGLRARGRPAPEIVETVARALALVRLSEYGARSIFALSGGQQQRIAVARALAVKPKLLLLDEPLSALDRKLRETMQMELRHLLRDLGITAIFVTHDQDEALVMSDRIAVMNAGRIEQFDAPAAIYTRPATPFVLDFVGMSTRLHGTVSQADGGEILVDTAVGRVRARARLAPGTRVLVAVRPEELRLGPPQGNRDNAVELRVRDPVFLGSKLILHFQAPEGDRAVAELPPAAGNGLAPGDRVTVSWDVAVTMVYPAA
ncbi:MAG TPA: ABC transporter ATP-binding protein [Methylomirabilota bacterium]|jgi:putative spermidine/putrescine transport system ATP-binding protein|nr:ABC transporter ATP-binding protein [Methylomirabilota bacterium]